MIYSLQNPKDLQNAIGFISLYSASPALCYDTSAKRDSKTKAFDFISIGEKDSSNILKTLEHEYVDYRLSAQETGKENQPPPKERSETLNFYLLEDHPINLLRSLVGFEIMRSPEYSVTEKINAYADFFGNFYVTKRTTEILEEVLIKFEMLFSGDSKVDPSLESVYVVKGLKFKQRDQLADLLKTWLSVTRTSNGKKEYWEESRGWGWSNRSDSGVSEPGLVERKVGRARKPGGRGLRLGREELPRPHQTRLHGGTRYLTNCQRPRLAWSGFPSSSPSDWRGFLSRSTTSPSPTSL